MGPVTRTNLTCMHVCRVPDGGANVFAFLSLQIPILDALLDSNALNLLQKCVGDPAQNRPQRFKPVLKVRGKSRAEFTNVLKPFQAALSCCCYCY